MTSLPKFHDKLERPSSKEDWKWAKRGLGAVAVGVVLIGGGNLLEYLRSDDYVEVTNTQRQELQTLNQDLLARVSALPFDASGRAEQAFQNPEKPDYKNTLAVQLSVEGDEFTIDGHGRHVGVTTQSSAPYSDPASFSLTFQLSEANNVHAVPAELLKQVVESGQMPSDVHYSLTEDRPGLGRYGDEDGIGDVGSKEKDVVMKIGPSGELLAIQIGDRGMDATSEDVTNNVKEAYGDVSAELTRVGA